MSLATLQFDSDLKRLGKTPQLLRRKWTRMSASPFAFLRGASALWAEVMRREPGLLRGPGGAGVLVGDLHLENVGTFRTARGVALHVNDFDETFVGPWSFDVLRLLTSTLLARPELGCTGLDALELAHEVLQGHAAGIAGATARLPLTLSQVVRLATEKPESKFLARRLDGDERLVRDEKTPSAPANRLPLVKRAVAEWAAQTKQTRSVKVLDVTRRIAGTGSLGVERLIALVRVGDQERLLELKEVRGSGFSALKNDAERLIDAWVRCLPRPPDELAAALLGQVPVVVRPLWAADEKLGVEHFDRNALPQTLRAIGVMAGEVHRRGATRVAKWSLDERETLIDRAVHLAALHEGAYLEFCRRVGDALA